MKRKLNVAVIFGGRSPEHAISLLSAQNIIKSLDRSIYNPILVGISRSGQWFYNEASLSLMEGTGVSEIALSDGNQEILLSQNAQENQLISVRDGSVVSTIDVIFPILHGTYGEDGSIQGLAKLANIPCVGCGIPGSAIGMDKDLMKRILRDANIAVAPGITLRRSQAGKINYKNIEAELGHELFIKPANLGSSVGVSFVKDEESFNKAIKLAFEYDHKVLVEGRVIGREVECAVLGNLEPEASPIGEIITNNGFYSFESKYVDENGARLAIPADLTDLQVQSIQEIAIETFLVLECRGLSRVDMFLCPNGEIIVNEINTMPGFTNISMYPKLWELTGLSNTALITKLINLALDDHNETQRLRIE